MKKINLTELLEKSKKSVLNIVSTTKEIWIKSDNLYKFVIGFYGIVAVYNLVSLDLIGTFIWVAFASAITAYEHVNQKLDDAKYDNSVLRAQLEGRVVTEEVPSEETKKS